MKALAINGYDYCELPKGVHDLDDAIEFLNQNYNSFVKFKVWEEEKCVAPYFIKEKQKEKAINISDIQSIEVIDIKVLPESEYMERLVERIKEKCIHCKHYEGEGDWDSHRDKLSLDGECFLYDEKTEE